MVRSLKDLQIRRVNILPDDLQIKPQHPDDLYFNERINVGLTMLFGLTPLGSKSVGATRDNCLKAASYGSGYYQYGVLSGTAPDSYDTTNQLEADNVYHKWDLLIETNDAEVRFYDVYGDSWQDSFIVPAGFFSIELTTTKVQIKNRTAGSAAVYQIRGFV